MTQLVIKSSSLPTRCDICHQRDCFEPASGHCSRCGDLAQSALINPASARTHTTSNNIAIGSCVGMLSGIIGSGFTVMLGGIFYMMIDGNWLWINNPFACVYVMVFSILFMGLVSGCCGLAFSMMQYFHDYYQRCRTNRN